VAHPLRRALIALLLLWLVCTLTFGLIHLAPGDAALILLPPGADAQTLASLRRAYGLDAPLPVQYLHWLGNIASGDLGTSLASGQRVSQLVRDALPISVALGASSLIVSVLLGVFVAGVQARRAGGAADTGLTIVTTMLTAAPTFWLALVAVAAVTVGAVALGVPPAWRLPAFGMQAPGLITASIAWGDLLRHALLPVLVLAIPGAAAIARFARASLVEASRSDAPRTARAKGVPAPEVWARHVRRLALPALVTLVALSLPGLVAGSVFVESVFAWPGMGRALLSAVAQRDHPVILAITLVYGATVITANFAADLLLPRLDPRRARA
jgi:peptide/nickel transport system permease protein